MKKIKERKGHMKMNISLKRTICFLLAVLMLISVVGCKENKKKKPPKVVIRDKVVLREHDSENNTNVDSSIPNNKVEEVTTRAKRALLDVPEEETEKIPFDTLHKEQAVPEFEYKNVNFAGNLADYVIVYSNSKDKNGASTNARILAEKLATFFKDNDNVQIPVKEEKTVTGSEKMIIVGDTAYYKSSLSENEFAVNIKGDNIVFEGGHIVMAEKAVDWFRTIKRENGKIATLNGKQDDFASTIKLENYDKELVYVWGDEFDGDELVDRSKWHIGAHMPQWSDLEYLKNDEVCYVKDGKLRMTVIRKLSEDNPDVGWASCGSYDTEDTMSYRNGYIEFDAKISYTQGIIMPLWLMSNPDGGLIIPKEQYGAAWTLEFDIFETFSNGDTWDVSIHKYYKPYNYSHNGQLISNGIANVSTDENGNPAEITTFHGREIYRNIPGASKPEKNVFQTKIVGGWAGWGYITSWRNAYNETTNPYYNPDDNQKQKYTFTGEELEKLNDSYHRYGLLYTKDGYKMYIDGKCWLERDWVYDWDSTDAELNANNGWGYNLYYYLIMNQHPYTPTSGYVPSMWIDNFDIPISSFINSVRVYQVSNEIDIFTPAYDE